VVVLLALRVKNVLPALITRPGQLLDDQELDHVFQDRPEPPAPDRKVQPVK